MVKLTPKHGRQALIAAVVCIVGFGAAYASPARAADEPPAAESDQQGDLAKKLQNPVANLISVPLQNNVDFGIGTEDTYRYTLNVQPVIPVSLGEDWNAIVRTIVPFSSADGPVEGAHDQTGLGDVVQSFFFSPKAPVGGWILGVGPVGLYPTASRDALGAGRWGAGPTAVVLKQDSGWTYGLLANHIWSFAGEGDRPDVDATFVQPFLSYTAKTFTTFSLNTESTYDWENSKWIIPVNLSVAQLLKVGGQPFQLQAGIREYAERPDGGPDWGLRFTLTFLFPT